MAPSDLFEELFLLKLCFLFAKLRSEAVSERLDQSLMSKPA